MQQYVKKMKIELADLEGKIKKLGNALSNKGIYELTETQKEKMKEQLSFMQGYKMVLMERIDMESK